MSSLSRRACYKCGNVGHYAEVCSSSERLCYNCKQPGHESNNCPHPRTTETKQCYHCQGLGHVQADCPTLRLSGGTGGGRCYSCGQMGHLARNCPNPNTATAAPPVGRGAGGPPRGGYGGGFRGGYAGNTRAATLCYKCGGPNHFARDCQGSVNEVLRLWQAWTHIARLHCSERRAIEPNGQNLLSMRRDRSYQPRLPASAN